MLDQRRVPGTRGASGPRAALSAEQKEGWERDGYLILPRFFGPDIIDPVNALIARLSDPASRPHDMARRVVVDLLGSGDQHRRMRLADAPVGALRRPVKFNDLFLESRAIRACNLHPRLVPVLDELLDGPPVVCNSLNFIQGSEQHEHIDSWYMPPRCRRRWSSPRSVWRTCSPTSAR